MVAGLYGRGVGSKCRSKSKMEVSPFSETSGGTVEVVSEKEVVKVGTEVNSGKDGIHPITPIELRRFSIPDILKY